MDRRGFIATTLGLPAVAHRHVALRADLRLGYAAITWGGNDPDAINDIASVGYRGIQLRTSAVARWESDPPALKALLAEKRLTFVALSSGVLALDPAREDESLALHTRHAEFAAKAGALYVQVVDERPRNRAITEADHQRMGRLLTTLGRRCADIGVKLGYHNHMGNLGESPAEVAAILSYTDARLVGFELDTAHWAAAGGNPVRAVRDFRDRLLFLHLKDLQRNVDGRPYKFVELGAGELDMAGVLRELDRVGFTDWAIVELDAVTAVGRSARDSAIISREFLAAQGYAL